MPNEGSKLNVSLSLRKQEKAITGTITAASGAKIVVTCEGDAQLEDGLQLLFDALVGVAGRDTAMAAMQSIAAEIGAIRNPKSEIPN